MVSWIKKVEICFLNDFFQNKGDYLGLLRCCNGSEECGRLDSFPTLHFHTHDVRGLFCGLAEEGDVE